MHSGILGGPDSGVVEDDQVMLDPSSNLGMFLRRSLLAFNLLSFEVLCFLTFFYGCCNCTSYFFFFNFLPKYVILLIANYCFLIAMLNFNKILTNSKGLFFTSNDSNVGNEPKFVLSSPLLICMQNFH